VVNILDTFTYSEDYRVQNFLNEASRFCERDLCRHRCDEECVPCIYRCAVETFWEEVAKIGKTTYLRQPTGIHVTKFRGETRVYIADSLNERVIACDLDGNIWMEYRRPITATFDDVQSFNPSKVIADQAGNVYVCLTTITQGAIRYDEDGDFKGYFGANRVTRTVDAIVNYVLRFVLSREAMRERVKPAPVEFTNFTIDHDQFIYTVTATRQHNNVDVLKKLDPAGRNVFQEQGMDGWVWGDFTSPYVFGRVYRSQIVDVSVDKKGDIYLLDRESGKVFQYDKEGSLMFVFGGKGEQKGLFNTPISIEAYGDKVYVLDSTKNSLTVFKLTEFGGLVLDAMALFNRGAYQQSIEPWEEVMRRDANYYMAYIGMGNAMLSIGEFDKALDYFYRHSYGGYNLAFKDYRINFIRNNFDKMLVVVLIAVGLGAGTYFLVKVIRKRRKSKGEI
jgi:hypothetical protein